MAADVSTQKAAGRVEEQVQRDLDRLGKLDEGVRGSLAAVALTLARALDRADNEEDLTKVAQVSLQLRQTLTSMTSVSHDSALLQRIQEWMSTPT